MLTLNNDCLASVTAVPDLFLEQYMPAANGEFVKVYLYLLKLVKDHQQDSTLSSMADFFSCTENDGFGSNTTDFIRPIQTCSRCGFTP